MISQAFQVALAAALLCTASTAAAAASPRDSGVKREIRAAIAAELNTSFGLPTSANVKISHLRTMDGDALKRATHLNSISLPAGQRLSRSVTARAHVRTANGEREIWIRADLDVRVPTLVATRNLPRGAQLSAYDLTLRQLPYKDDALTDPAMGVGRVTQRSIREGKAVTASAIRLPSVVYRGTQVVAVVGGTAFRIRARGEALDDGAIGDTVRVRIQGSHRVVQGRVARVGEIEVIQ